MPLNPRHILLAYAALALGTALFSAIGGRLPVPAGNAEMLLPDARTPPVADRNDELSDVPMQFLPWSRAVADAYRGGRLPLRFSANGCGVPLWANPQAQAVTPTTLFTLLLPLPWAYAASAAAKLWLAAAGAFAFLRARRLSTLAASWGGLAYGFAIHMTAWIHYPDTWPAALLPWTLLALDRLARGAAGGFLATTAAVFFLLLGGYPETELFVAAAGAVLFLGVLLGERLERRERLARLGRAAAASILALGLTAAYTVPAAIALSRSERSAHVAAAIAGSHPTLSARDFVRPPLYWDVSRFWLVPEAQGNPRDQDKFGPYSFAGRAGGYAGILVVALAVAGFLRRGAPPSIVGARWALLGLALYILWYPPLVYLLHATPGLREAALRLTTNRANGIAVLLLAWLAAWELGVIERGARAWTTRIGVLAALAGVGIVLFEFAKTADRPPLTAWRAASFALPIALLLAAGAALALRPGSLRTRVLAAILIGGTAVDLLRIGARFNPGTLPADYYPLTPGVRALREAAAGGRFAAGDPTLAGAAYMYGLEDVRVHGVTAPAAYVDALQAAAGYTGPAEYPSRVGRLEAPFLDFLNTRARLHPGPIRRVDTPAAVLPDRLVGVADSSTLRARLAAGTDFLRQAFVIGADETFAGKSEVLAIQRPSPEEIRVRVRCDDPRVLVLPETDDGGWTARAKAGPLATFRLNGAFLGIRVPAGETAIVCRYAPPGIRAGAWISLASAALLAATAVAIRRRR
ncbi:MAG TPA: hypothetical protein VGH97_17985 [Thermoanaerobaculia bacterium]